jgi:hypothetical protein
MIMILRKVRTSRNSDQVRLSCGKSASDEM